MKNITGLKPGDKLKAKRTIRYVLGQIASDKICRNEVVTVEKLNPHVKGAVLLEEHADRYGPWYLEDFVPVAANGKHLRKGQRVVFDGKWGKIIDTNKYNEGPFRQVFKVHIAFDDGTKSWEVEDDDKMGTTPETKAKIDKLAQVIKSAKNPHSEFYRVINHLLK